MVYVRNDYEKSWKCCICLLVDYIDAPVCLLRILSFILSLHLLCTSYFVPFPVLINC